MSHYILSRVQFPAIKQSEEQHIHTARTDSQEHHEQTQHSIKSLSQYITVRPVDSHKERKQPRTSKKNKTTVADSGHFYAHYPNTSI